MIIAVVVFISMSVMDAFAAIKILLLQRNEPWRAGFAEAGNDLGGIFSYGLGGASLLKYGFSGTTAVILIALCSASVLGTRLGCFVEGRLSRKEVN